MHEVDDTIDLAALRARLNTGSSREYWRSLEELAQTDEFQNYLTREFPSQLAVWEDRAGRRQFLQLMAASLALAGLSGCTNQPNEQIIPYVHAPEEIVPGKPLYFATALPRGGDALGLLVESHMGRPTKVEGNPEHPASLGATDAIAQASILDLYDPDRAQTVLHRGLIETWDNFSSMIARERERLTPVEGAGLRILTESVASPTLAWQLEQLLAAFPQAKWHQYEPMSRDRVREGALRAFGQDVEPLYHFDQAEIVVSLDADFVASMPGSIRYARDFISNRRATVESTTMSRLYVAECTPTLTGAMADHRLPLAPAAVELLAQALAARLEVPGFENAEVDVPGVSAEWLTAVTGDLQSHRGKSLVLAGRGQSAAVHAIAHHINEALENRSKTVSYIEPVMSRPESQQESLATLVQDMRDGKVTTLIIIGGNPVYTAPGELEFASALAAVATHVHLSDYLDETSRRCQWHVPAAHYLEGWSDARGYDGTASIVQPLIAPLYGGKTAHELMGVLAGETSPSSYEIVQAYWRQNFAEADFGRSWRRAVHDGVIVGTASAMVEPMLTPWPADAVLAATDSGANGGGITIELRADSSMADGRHANNGWLQELPRPLTKITWDNAAMISPATAERLGISSGDVLEVTRGQTKVEVPAWIMPGQSNDCLSLTLGYGRSVTGRIGTGVGYDAYPLLPAGTTWFVADEVRSVGRKHRFSTTQNHHSMEGRDIIRVATWDRVQNDLENLFADKHHGELPGLYPPFDHGEQPNAWGMVIDQSACTGCNACVIACQAENNIPIVGKEQVGLGREMHWLRIDRYYHGEAGNPLDNPETYFQPMMCVHCEQAPCEVVCPVAATVHDAEGLNNMIYNRCVGTRYCSNNCPYKVRRFNFLEYRTDTSPSLAMLNNPDVTVRTRGVMEKCTYCIQRISAGRIASKRENEPIVDGEVRTACQQACPTQAIVFGNLNDTKSAVHQLKQSPLNYGVLAELNTRPRTTYLPRIVNSHADLPPPTAAGPAPTDEPRAKDKAHS